MDGLKILGDVFSPVAVAPGGTRGQAAVFVDQFHGAAVHLGLQDIFKLIRGLEEPLQPLVELPGLGLAEGVFQRQHGLPVPHGFKFIQGLGPDPLRGRIRRGQAVGFLQPGEFSHEPVKLGIRDHRIVQHIVAVIVVVELFPEFGHPGDHLRGNFLFCHGRCTDEGGLAKGPAPRDSRKGQQVAGDSRIARWL